MFKAKPKGGPNFADADAALKSAVTKKKSYASQAQASFFHSPQAAQSNISADQVQDMDEASAGKTLPPKAAKKKGMPISVKNRIGVRRALKK